MAPTSTGSLDAVMAPGEQDLLRWRPSRAVALGTFAAVAGPLGVLAVLRLVPDVDVAWENHQAHFWIVFAAAALAFVLGHSVATAARHRRDARLFLIALAFITSAGFLGLHALATPGVLVGPNAGFELATPVGLVLGSGFVALSAVELPVATSRRIMAWSRWLLGLLVVVIAAWAAVSLLEVPPLDDPVPRETLDGWQVVFAVLAIAGYGGAAWGYYRLHRRRGSRFVFAVVVAFALLAVAMVIIALAVNWRLSWWWWHVVMLAAFALIGVAAREEWHEERFSDLYLERSLADTTEASILFADLQGFTSYAERVGPVAVQAMLSSYLTRLVPLMQQMQGEVHQLIGDAVMVVFNKQGDQPDHALLAARAALAFQQEATRIAEGEPDLPRFRVGVNSGEVVAAVLGDRGHRKHDVIGDTVNLAARLESAAPVGEVLIGEGTFVRLPDGTLVEPVPPFQVKGKSEPTVAYLLCSLPS
jgi:adenylate cyclase